MNVNNYKSLFHRLISTNNKDKNNKSDEMKQDKTNLKFNNNDNKF